MPHDPNYPGQWLLQTKAGRVFGMTDGGRVVTARLPLDVAEELDLWATRGDRSKSWIIRQALTEWIAEEQRRYELTLEALKEVEEGRTHTQEEIEAMAAARKAELRRNAQRS